MVVLRPQQKDDAASRAGETFRPCAPEAWWWLRRHRMSGASASPALTLVLSGGCLLVFLVRRRHWRVVVFAMFGIPLVRVMRRKVGGGMRFTSAETESGGGDGDGKCEAFHRAGK